MGGVAGLVGTRLAITPINCVAVVLPCKGWNGDSLVVIIGAPSGYEIILGGSQSRNRNGVVGPHCAVLCSNRDGDDVGAYIQVDVVTRGAGDNTRAVDRNEGVRVRGDWGDRDAAGDIANVGRVAGGIGSKGFV